MFRKTSPAAWLIVLCPFAFFGWMVWSPQTIGNDYQVYQVEAALNLRAYGHMGLVPMWFPHLTGGFPMGGLSLAQAWNAPAALSSLLPGYWTGGALLWMTARHLVLLALAHALHYAACRRLARLPKVASAFVAFAAVYNLRTLDELRYGPALDAAVYGHGVVILAAWQLVDPRRWRLAALVVLVQLLLTSGYPVLLPFQAIAGFALVPFAWLRAGGARPLLARLPPVAAAFGIGTLLAAPHWLSFVEWMRVNASRVQNPSLRWATDLQLEPSGLWANVVAPWAAPAPSAFGGSVLVTLVILTAFVIVGRAGPRAWPALLALALPFAYALGSASPVYRFAFRHLPLFSSLRTPGRALDVVPLVVIGSLAFVDALRPDEPWSERLSRALPAAAALQATLLAAAIVTYVAAGPPAAFARYSPADLLPFWQPGARVAWWVLACVACGAALLARRRPRTACIVAGACAAIQTAMLMRHGTWIEDRQPTPSLAAFQAADQLPLYGTPPLPAENSLMEGSVGLATMSYTFFVKSAGAHANCYLPVDPGERHRGVLLPFYLSSHVSCVGHRREALARIADQACRRGSLLRTFVASPDCMAPPLPDTNADLVAVNAANRLLALTPNLATLRLASPLAGVLVTPYPDATDNWTATIDGRPVPLLQVNGGFIGVAVPAGPHDVSIRYFSRLTLVALRLAALGALLAALAALVWLAPGLGRSRLAAAAVLMAVLIGLGEQALERDTARRASRPTLLPNGYAALLQQQLDRWAARP